MLIGSRLHFAIIMPAASIPPEFSASAVAAKSSLDAQIPYHQFFKNREVRLGLFMCVLDFCTLIFAMDFAPTKSPALQIHAPEQPLVEASGL